MEILYWYILTVGGFLLGSVMFCELIPKKVLNKDICKISVDNNPGAFNVFKHCGKKIGFLCLLCDLLKGFVTTLLASLFLAADSVGITLVMVAPPLGHAIGLFNRFRGGKCIATAFGVMLGIIPVTFIGICALAALYILFSTVIKIKNTAKRSVLVFVLFALTVCPVLCVTGPVFPAIGCGLVALLPIVKFVFCKNGLVENKFSDETLTDKRG
ncbi:MAG: glycerol-3-phosphate acyltransferase [Clostridia bacterium]|nr:glycerol-3-phosphate acyltransferase [Clostridia bacterium]